jgi:hypothetical protein
MVCGETTDITFVSKTKRTNFNWEPDSSVGIATGHGLDGQGSIPGSEKYFSYPQRPDRLWVPTILLSNGHRW